MMTRTLLLAIALSATPPVVAARQSRDHAGSYTWIEGAAGAVHSANDAVPSSVSARDTFRVASNFRVMPHLYAQAAYTVARSRYGDINEGSAGLGAYVPLHQSLDGILQLSYERLDFTGDGPDAEHDGVGVEAGARWHPGSPQLDLSLKRTALEADLYGTNERYTRLNAAALLPIRGALGLSFRFERTSFSGGLLDGVEFDTYLLGLRYALGGP